MRLIWLVALVTVLLSSYALAKGCGSRGGPGFRGPDGKCVGWKNLTKLCGHPPTTHCTYEGRSLAGAPPGSGAGFLAGAGAVGVGILSESTGARAYNERTTRRDSLACVSQSAIAHVTTCSDEKSATTCASERQRAVSEGICVNLTTGTVAKIEASSRSDAWLRIRPAGHRGEFWVPRKLLLD